MTILDDIEERRVELLAQNKTPKFLILTPKGELKLNQALNAMTGEEWNRVFDYGTYCSLLIGFNRTKVVLKESY